MGSLLQFMGTVMILMVSITDILYGQPGSLISAAVVPGILAGIVVTCIGFKIDADQRKNDQESD